MKYLYYLIISFFTLFNTNLFSEQYYQRTIVIDNAICTNCDISMLKHYIGMFKHLKIDESLTIYVTNNKRKEIALLKQKLSFERVIYDSAFLARTYVLNLKLPALFISNNEGHVYFKRENLNDDPIALTDLSNQLSVREIDLSNSTVIDESVLPLIKSRPPLFNKGDSLIALIDPADNIIKLYGVKNGNFVKSIEAPDDLKHYFIEHRINEFQSLIKEDYPLVTFNNAVIFDHKLLLTANIIANAIYDTLVYVNKSGDTVQQNYKNYMPKSVLIVISIENPQSFQVIELSPEFHINNINFEGEKYYSVIKYKNSMTHDELISKNIMLCVSYKSFESDAIAPLLTHKELIEACGIESYNDKTIGIAKISTSGALFYINPWNNAFIVKKTDEIKQIEIGGFLNSVKVSKQVENSYFINNMYISDDNAYIMIQQMKDRKTDYFILQKYDADSGLKSEFIFYSKLHKFYYTYLISVENGIAKLLLQTDDEQWHLVDVAI